MVEAHTSRRLVFDRVPIFPQSILVCTLEAWLIPKNNTEALIHPSHFVHFVGSLVSFHVPKNGSKQDRDDSCEENPHGVVIQAPPIREGLFPKTSLELHHRGLREPCQEVQILGARIRSRQLLDDHDSLPFVQLRVGKKSVRSSL